jgi:hypothetical protein
MPKDFGEKWKIYVNLFWKKVAEKITIDPPILFWGHIPYSEFEKTAFHSKKPLSISDPKQNVYFMGRTLKNEDISLFFFVNLQGIELDLRRICTPESLFILDILFFGFDLASLFEHDYSQDCWDALLKTKEIVFG